MDVSAAEGRGGGGVGGVDLPPQIYAWFLLKKKCLEFSETKENANNIL